MIKRSHGDYFSPHPLPTLLGTCIGPTWKCLSTRLLTNTLRRQTDRSLPTAITFSLSHRYVVTEKLYELVCENNLFNYTSYVLWSTLSQIKIVQVQQIRFCLDSFNVQTNSVISMLLGVIGLRGVMVDIVPILMVLLHCLPPLLWLLW